MYLQLDSNVKLEHFYLLLWEYRWHWTTLIQCINCMYMFIWSGYPKSTFLCVYTLLYTTSPIHEAIYPSCYCIHYTIYDIYCLICLIIMACITGQLWSHKQLHKIWFEKKSNQAKTIIICHGNFSVSKDWTSTRGITMDTVGT